MSEGLGLLVSGWEALGNGTALEGLGRLLLAGVGTLCREGVSSQYLDLGALGIGWCRIFPCQRV